MQLYYLRNIHLLYIIIFLNSSLEALQEFPTSKQNISLEIELKCIMSDYNQGYIIHEVCTLGCKSVLPYFILHT